MSLTELMSGMDLAIYPQVALVIFLIAFVAVVVRVISRRARGEFERAASLPLNDEPGLDPAALAPAAAAMPGSSSPSTSSPARSNTP